MTQLTASSIPTDSYGPDNTRPVPTLTHNYTAPDGKQYHTQIVPNGWFVYEGNDASGRRIAHKSYPAYDPLEEAKAAIAKHFNSNNQ